MRRNSFGQFIREQRRRLELTQQEVAHRISASPSYVALLESGRRRPSKKTLISIANAVGLDALELYLLANPGAREMLDHGVPSGGASCWETFRKDEALRRAHSITPEEMRILSQVALLGEIQSPRFFIYILNTIRQALGR